MSDFVDLGEDVFFFLNKYIYIFLTVARAEINKRAELLN